jgi:hypothetical protein
MRASAAAVLVAVLLSASACGGDEAAPVLPPGRAIETTRVLSPTTHLFADPAHARLEVLVDRRLLDPDRIRITTGFEPYEVVGGRRFSRRDLGEYTRLRYDYTLRCLTADCIPVRLESILGELEEGRGERRTFRFPPAQVRYDDPAGEAGDFTLSVGWPQLTSVSRLNEGLADAEFPFRLSPTPLPALSYRASPPLVAAVSFVLGVLLLVIPARVAVRWWRRRRPVPEEPPAVELTPLERARALLVWSSERDAVDRRRAVSNFAAELARAGGDGLVDDALGLAWSKPSPRAEAVLELARYEEQA